MTMRFSSIAVMLAIAAASPAQEAPAEGKALALAAMEQHLYGSLRNAINYGADLYNNRDSAGCYHVFRTALATVVPLLEHRPELQRAVTASLTEAERNPDMSKRAWILRKSLDQVRSTIKPTKKPPVPPKKDPPRQTLWQQLGGVETVRQVVDRWFELAGSDPNVNLSRDGKFMPSEEEAAKLKQLIVAQISAATGGPLKYTGKSMKAVHKGMGITNAEFDAAVKLLIDALKTNKVDPEAGVELIKIVEKTRVDIVEKKE